MPISPIGSIIYANQNTQVAATKQTDFQSRVDFQNMIAAKMLNEKDTVIEDLDDIDEKVAVNPDKEHQREQSDETTGEKEMEQKAVLKTIKKTPHHEEDEELGGHILDIRV